MTTEARETNEEEPIPRAGARLAAATAYDAAALRVLERVRSSLDLDEVLQYAVDELGEVVGASRALVQLAPDGSGKSAFVEWDRGGTLPLQMRPPTPIARRVFASRAPVVIARRSEVDDPEILAYLVGEDVESAVTCPVAWHGEILAVVGFQDDVARDWHRAALPLIERVEPQLAAAIVQAQLFQRQSAAVAELQRIARLREELVANVSHDLRTPLAAIVGTIKTLRRRDGAVDVETAHRLLTAAEDQANRLELLVEDILELNRVSHGAGSLRREPVEVRELVDAVLAQVAVPDGREIAVGVPHGLVLHGDRRRLAQLLTNLVENALRHGGGRVSIEARRTPESVRIAVGDEGPGVPPGQTEQIFEPFAYASARSDSTGLGLSIARAVAHAHGGTLRYDPPAHGREHRFVLELP